MPEICRFYGIIIGMFYNEHYPPHFHAKYGEFSADIRISDFEVIKGTLPPRALGLVVEWATLHKKELEKNWETARRGNSLTRIEPLR